MADRSDFRPLGGSTKKYVNRETGEIISYRQYLRLTGKPPKSKSRREREKRERVAAGLPEKVDRRSPLGSKKERRAISLDPADWTPREKQIIRNWITAHPYDATIDMVRTGENREVWDDIEKHVLFNLAKKLQVLDLKYNVGILTKREYERQRKAVQKIRAIVPYTLGEGSMSVPYGSDEYWKLRKRAEKEYAKLRKSSIREKRLVMTLEEFNIEQELMDKLDVFHEIFYH